MKIGYVSEPDKDYSRLLPLQKTLKDLRAFTKTYERIAADAHEVAMAMSEEDFKEFRRGLAIERKGEFAGEEWCIRFGAIPMPLVFMEVGLMAQKFCVPFGLAYKRMLEVGRIIEDEQGIARVPRRPSTSSEGAT